jgi:hypothetical protein
VVELPDPQNDRDRGLAVLLLDERAGYGVAGLALAGSEEVRQFDAEEVEGERAVLGLAPVAGEELLEARTGEEDAVSVGAVEEGGRLAEVLAAEEVHHRLQPVREAEAHLELHAEEHQHLAQLQEGQHVPLALARLEEGAEALLRPVHELAREDRLEALAEHLALPPPQLDQQLVRDVRDLVVRHDDVAGADELAGVDRDGLGEVARLVVEVEEAERVVVELHLEAGVREGGQVVDGPHDLGLVAEDGLEDAVELGLRQLVLQEGRPEAVHLADDLVQLLVGLLHAAADLDDVAEVEPLLALRELRAELVAQLEQQQLRLELGLLLDFAREVLDLAQGSQPQFAVARLEEEELQPEERVGLVLLEVLVDLLGEQRAQALVGEGQLEARWIAGSRPILGVEHRLEQLQLVGPRERSLLGQPGQRRQDQLVGLEVVGLELGFGNAEEHGDEGKVEDSEEEQADAGGQQVEKEEQGRQVAQQPLEDGGPTEERACAEGS